MPLDQQPSASLEGVDVQHPAQAQDEWDVVRRTPGVEVVQEPQPLLGEGQREDDDLARRRLRFDSISVTARARSARYGVGEVPTLRC